MLRRYFSTGDLSLTSIAGSGAVVSQDVSGISVARRNLNGPKQRHLFAGAGGLVIENRRLMCYKSPWGNEVAEQAALLAEPERATIEGSTTDRPVP
jgi:hypothetical protein